MGMCFTIWGGKGFLRMANKAIIVFAVLAALTVLGGCRGQAHVQLLPGDEQSTESLQLVPVDEQSKDNSHVSPESDQIIEGIQLFPRNEQPVSNAKSHTDGQNTTDTQLLTEDEQNIADVLIHVAHKLLNMRASGEHPIVALLEDAVVEVSYVQGYFWRADSLINLALLDVAPKGITCFLRTAEPSWDGVTYAAFNIGRRDDGTYISHIFGSFFVWEDLDEYLSNRINYQPLDNPVQTFTLYIPPRATVSYTTLARVETAVYEAYNSSIMIRYPQVVRLLDYAAEAKLNELIRAEALLVLNQFPLDSLEHLSLTIDFEVKLLNLNVMSIVYYGHGAIEGAGRVNKLFYSTNIDMQSIGKVHLDDYICID